MSSNQGTNPNPDSKKETAGGKQDTSGGTQGTGTKVLKKGNFLGDYKGCKVLLSSRDKKVFRDEVDVESNFCLKELDGNDALMLFEKVIGGGNKMSMPKEEIQNYCTGLPMRIVTFGVAFKNWIESESKPTLDKFKKQGLVEWQKSSETPNKKKYDLPKNKELKFIYLLCAQMGHLPLVNDLVKYCFGLGIFEGVSSLSAAREKINESIQELKNLSLVSYENPNIHFHMSHMVRDDALSNALMDHNVFAFRDGKLDYWPDLEKCISISICNSYITDGFPQVINCPQLQFLQIETNDPSLKIPERFFSCMKNLLVLILTGFHLSSLPYSIGDLLNLRMLCLERCILDCNLSVLRKFKKLRILSFSGSQLKNLPNELRYLDKLRMLDISDCFKLKIIPFDLFSNLTCLEELYIRKSLIKMLVEKGENKGHNSFLSELKNLHQLKVVDLSIPCVSILPSHLFFDRLKDYKIEIGDLEMFSVGEFRMPNKYEELKVLTLQLKDDTDIHSHQGIKLLFKTAQSLFLGKICVQNVVNELNIDGFQNLKHLSIINNNDVEYVNSTDLSNCVNIFSNLESLCLYNMMKLKMICHGPITIESFAKLKTIKVEMCCQLENLFSFDAIKISASTGTSEIFKCNSNMKKFLASLEMIEVCECGSLKEILQIPLDCGEVCECESLKQILQIPQDYGKVEFLKLRTLTLQSLPSFTCFYTKVERSCWPHSTEAQTTNRGHTKISTEQGGHNDNAPPLFGELVEVPNLENLNLSSLNIHKIWSDQYLSSFYFQNLIKLVVKDCDKLTHLCSLPMASSLKKLKSLVISGCLKMEQIFEIEGSSENKVCVFPKLEEIHLNKMKRLTDMWQTEVGIDSFSSLISVRIEECDQLDKIFPSHMEGWFESLINLQISKCKSVKEIFEINDSQEIDASGGIDTNLQVILLEGLPKLKELWSKDPDGILNFKKLRTIDVSYCDELRNLFPASVAKDVSKLERMSVLRCKRMVEIVSNKDTSEANNDPLEFPELTFVRLYALPNMKQFYKGRHPIKCSKLKELSMGKCMKLKTFLQETSDEKFVFSSEAVFPKLEYMEIDFEEAQNWLSNYKMLKLKELIILNSVHRPDLLYPFLYKMPNLEKLKLTSSYSESLETLRSTNNGQQDRLGVVLQLKQLFICSSDISDLGFERDQVLERLELLRLKGCYNLSNLGPSSVSLSYLTSLKLKRCHRLKDLVASSTAKTMVQLKTMKVINCRQVEQIVSNHRSEEGKRIKIVFSKLISIELVGLMNMTSFCGYKNCEFEFPLLEKLIVRKCPKMKKFSERESIAPKLKDIFCVEGDKKAKWQWEGDLNATIQKIFDDKLSFAYTEDLRLSDDTMEQLWQASRWVHQNSFGYLKSLSFWGCHTVVDVIPSHLLSFFHNLDELSVFSCRAAEVIFNMNDENRIMTKASPIFRLKTLSLSNLPKLEHIWEKDPEGIMGLQALEIMYVYGCGRLKSLFPASLATTDLTRLEVLEVRDCEELREIFGKDEKVGEGTTQHSAFPPLTTLTLDQLPRLTIHCSKQQESTSNLSEGDIQEICLGSRSIPNSYFYLLESLTLDGCEFLTDVLLPFNLLPFLTNLETLEVRNFDSVKIIFDVKCTTQEREMASMGQTLPFSLKKLVVSKLPNLENVWNENPYGILTLHHLQELHVEECKGLTSVFPPSVAKDVVELENQVVEDVLLPFSLLSFSTNLETLEVRKCDSVKTIFDVKCTTQGRDVTYMGQTLPFSLKKLIVSKLPNLKNVWNEDPQVILSMHHLQEVCVEECEGLTSVFPASKDKYLLKNLVVKDCKGLMIIFAEDNIDPRTKLELTCPFVRSLELEGLPNFKYFYYSSLYCDIFTDLESHTENKVGSEKLLKCLSLGEKGVNMILQGEFQPNLLDNIKALTLCLGSDLFRYGILERFPNIEKLVVCDGSFKEMFCCESGNNVLHQLKVLRLESLEELVSIGPENSWTDSFVRNLETFKVIKCGSLKSLVACTVSFSNLICLKVEGCHSLSYLLTSSTAKSLGQLKRMEIKNCDSIEEIVCKEESDEDEIIFPQLSCLNLEWLFKLKRFYRGRLSLPSLEELSVKYCKEMITFCVGSVDAGKLSQVTIDSREVIPLETDLNSIMWKKYLRKISRLDLDRSKPELQEIWRGSLPIPNFCFRELVTLKVNGCPFLSDAVLPFHLFSLLSKLETLEVRNCDSVKVIFDVVKCSTQHTLITFPVKNLVLSNLPELEAVWNEDPPHGILCMQHLKEVHVNECERLTSVFPAYVAKDLELEELVIEECERLVAIVAEDNTDSSLELTLPCPYVKSLKLRGLQKFNYFYCCSLNTHLESPTQDQLPNEKISRLDLNSSKPELREIWSGSLSISNFCFSKLATLIVEDCPFLSDAVIPFHLFPLLSKLETLEVRNCDSVKVIFDDVKCSTQHTLITSPMEAVWNADPPHGILCMQHLKKVHVTRCKRLTSVFPASVAKDLELEELVIEECERLVAIVAEDNTDSSLELTLPCPYVKSLKLRGLQKFNYFYYCSLNKHLESPTQDQLPHEKLQCLSLGENGMKMILRGELERNLLGSLKALTLCFGSDVFGYEILEEFPNIEKLVVCDGSLKEMFCCESGNNVLQQLKVLRLESLEELVSIGPGNSWTDSFVRNLESFEVIKCGSLKSLVAMKKGVSFSNLICLIVEGCDSLSYLFTSSTAKSLGQLKRMEIKRCGSIEEIVCKEESDEDEIIFPKLSCLNLEWLSKLKSFCKGSLSFPSLKELTVYYCREMITLCVGTVKADKLSQVTLDSKAIQLEIDLNSTIRKRFLKENTQRRSQKCLEFKDRADLQEIWSVSLKMHDFCFTYLETLIVDGCQLLSCVIPFAVLPLLPQLQTLQVRNCHSLKTIFDVKCTTQDTSITFPLKTLVLWKLPNLETLWNEDTDGNPGHPEGTNPNLTFPTLTSLTLWDLPNFNHNIHDATPTSELITPNLQHLLVGENELKMIVDGELQKNLLSELKVLGLCFDIECDEFPEYGFLKQLPNVKKLMVWSSSFKLIFCNQRPNNSELLLQLKQLRLESLGELVSIGLENSWTEPFVRNLKTFEVISCSSLENLVTCTVSFSNLICLKVKNCDSLSYLFTSSTAKSLGQLKRIEIENCKSIEEIVCGEESDDEEDEIIFPQLSWLKLYRLSNLRRLYRGSLSFPLLEKLSVTHCNDMVTLCPSTLKADKLTQVRIEYGKVISLDTDLNSTTRKEFGRKISELKKLELKSRPKLPEIWHDPLYIPDLCFSELVTLIVKNCQFLSDAVLPFHLLPLLPKLKTLEVGKCDSVKTIFDLKRTTKDTLVTLPLPLKKLSLSNLSNLENIWSEDPHGILIMHHLKQVHVKECKGLTSVFPASVAKDLIVDDCEGLKAIVADESKEDEIIFPQLMYLEVESCISLPYLFTSSTAKSLGELKSMKIKECKSIEEIISKEGEESDEKVEIKFEQLQHLYLEKLDELRCFYDGNFTLNFPSLEEVHVIKCSSMKTFSASNKIDNSIKWYYSEYARARKETDLNSALNRTSEEEVQVMIN
ncbi:uncharacterized protein LOC114166401 isoform X2 [Vigna unguiculata]|uniref:uncharacterized protein LOC114166401 isoform X2 n=1 Tax=Vigna unguiculata TaxID=3917 RepID=UPI001016D7CC|nr:uncharacterized protein LOC114166401 isoform X2 [Vigna unguiculata]